MEVAALTKREVILDMFKLDEEAIAMIDQNYMFDTWCSRAASYREILPMGEFRDTYAGGDVDNFVYYREAGVVFNTLVPACHQDFMGGLYSLHQLKKGKRQADTSAAFQERPALYNMFSGQWDGQDCFLKEGLGTYQSSCTRHMILHRAHPLNAQEKMMFQDLPLDVQEW